MIRNETKRGSAKGVNHSLRDPEVVAAAKRYARRKSKSVRKQGQNFTLREIAEALRADGYTEKILSAQSVKNLLAQKVPA